MLIFIDGSGSDNRDTLRRYGYSIRGKPPRSLKLLVRGECVSVIAAMSDDGVETLRVVRGTVVGDIFLEFIERDLLQVLQPFNGVKLEHCYIICRHTHRILIPLRNASLKLSHA